MTGLRLKYGNASLELHIGASEADVLVLEATHTPPATAESDVIGSALAHPIGSPMLPDVATSGQRVVVVTSDITRPCPSERLLPRVLDQLAQGGVCDQDITVVFGLGTHRSHTPEEQARLVGEEIYQRVRCIDSDPSDVELIGHTSRGTPVQVFRPVLEADLRICLGVIEYHYFVGYGGGFKAIVPGVCGVDTIQHNHRMMTDADAVAGRLDGNPVREDIDEAGEMVGAGFILNVILDETKSVVSAVAGHPRDAHREGCARLDALARTTVDKPADIVVVSAGGYPKDINLYQAQKALDNARHVVRPGGVILLIAECIDGLGNPTFEAWMQDPGGPEGIIARIKREFVLGGHKAAAVAMAMRQTDVFLVSALPSDFARLIGFYPFGGADQALRSALATVGPCPTVIVMPEGARVLPTVGQADVGKGKPWT
jgi:nickel-dependent lactate racemase